MAVPRANAPSSTHRDGIARVSVQTAFQLESDRLFEEALEPLDLAGGDVLGVAGEDPADGAEGLPDVHAAAVDGELADVLVVQRAAHLQNGEAALHLAEGLDVTQEDDRVGD